MNVVWERAAPTTARFVCESLDERAPTYNTVVTVLDRLAKKGLVVRERSGRVWTYRPSSDRDAHIASLMLATLDGAVDRTAALLRFADAIGADEARALHEALGRGSGNARS
jgi:predicted transcriptional regulator